jgi:peptide/nickel transport system substrate-binding protein
MKLSLEKGLTGTYMKKKVLLIIVPILFVLNCSNKNKPTPDSLVVALAAAPVTLDPRFSTDANGMRINSLIFNSLVKIGPELDVVGDAADSWEVKNNTFSFKLKPNLKFSNGRNVEEEDLRFSFSEYQKDNCPFQSSFKDIKNLNIKTLGEVLVIEFELSQFSAKFLSSDLPVFKILPKKEILEKPDEFAKNPMGTGPFKLNKIDANSVDLNVNEYFFSAKPKLSKMIFKIIRDDFTRYQKMINGEIDIAQSEIPLEKVKSFEEKREVFTVYKYPGLSFTYILLNLNDPVIKQFQARKAIAHAINTKEIIDFKLEGLGLQATSILTPSNPYFNNQLKPISFAVDLAKSIIENLKLKELKLVLKTSNTPAAVDIGKVIVNQLNQTGVTAELQSFEWGTFYGDITSGNFQLATMRWVGAIDPDIYRVALHSSEAPPGRNRGNYRNQKLDKLLDEGLSIKDQQKRIEHYQEVQKIVLEELPIIPLWYNQQVAIVNNRVKGYHPTKNGDFSSLEYVYK